METVCFRSDFIFCFIEVLLKSCGGCCRIWSSYHPGELSLEVLNPQKYTQLDLSSVTCGTALHLRRCVLHGRPLSEHHHQMKVLVFTWRPWSCLAALSEQAAQWDYGTTGCGYTLPGGLCVEQRLMQYFFVFTALLEIQCLHNNRFLCFLSGLHFILKDHGSLKAHSSLRSADGSNNSCLCALDRDGEL